MTTSDFSIILYTCVDPSFFFTVFKNWKTKDTLLKRTHRCVFVTLRIFLWAASKLLSGFLSASFRTNYNKPYEFQNTCMISQWIEDSVTNLSIWTPLSCVPWMEGFTPLEDTEKHWFSWKRDKSLFFNPLIEVLSSVEGLLNPRSSYSLTLEKNLCTWLPIYKHIFSRYKL